MNNGKGKPEAEVLKECLAYLRSKNIFCWRQNTGAFKTDKGNFFRSSQPGVSDILGVLPSGKFLAVECKREFGGVLSEHQKSFLFNVTTNHGVAIICRSAQELEEELQPWL